jgi:hypothetical protein
MSFSAMVTDYIVVEFISNENALALGSLIGTGIHLLATKYKYFDHWQKFDHESLVVLKSQVTTPPTLSQLLKS